jgi:hypothetical protein
VPTFLGRRAEEPVDAACQAFYKKLLTAIHSPVFREGEWRLCNCSGWPDNASFEHLAAWSWTKDNDRVLVVVNLSDTAVQARIHLPWDDLRGKTWRLEDSLSDAAYERDGNEMSSTGLHIELPPWTGQLLTLQAIASSGTLDLRPKN